MKLSRVLGEGGIIPELIKYEGKDLVKSLTILLSKCLEERNISIGTMQ